MDGLLRTAHRKKWGRVDVVTFVKWAYPVMLKRRSVQRILELCPERHNEAKEWPPELTPSPPGSTRP